MNKRRIKIKRVLSDDGKTKKIQAILLKGEMTDAELTDVARSYGLTIKKIRGFILQNPNDKDRIINHLLLMFKNMLDTRDIIIRGVAKQIKEDLI